MGTKDESRVKSEDSNPVSRALKGRSDYGVLGVPEGSTDEEIRQAFRQLARVVHPDKNRDPRAGEAFAKVQQAFSGVQRSIIFSAKNVLDILLRTVSTKVVP